MNINWYPGHMAKSLKLLKSYLNQVDAVIELCDARLPRASRTPALSETIGDKPHILWLNKADMADPDQTTAWLTFFKQQGLVAAAGSAFSGRDRKDLLERAFAMAGERLQRAEQRGIGGQNIRLMLVGIPNCGKSTLINHLAGRKAAGVEDRPGVTRGAQWIRTTSGFDLLDMPGILPTHLGSRQNQILLAATGAIKDSILDLEGVAYEALTHLIKTYPAAVSARFGLTDLEGDPYDLFLQAAKNRGAIRSGGRPDEGRFARIFLKDLRSGALGRLTLESPTDETATKSEGN